jgi:hypothetical protein
LLYLPNVKPDRELEFFRYQMIDYGWASKEGRVI